MLDNTCLVIINNAPEFCNRLQFFLNSRGCKNFVQLGIAGDSVLYHFKDEYLIFYDYFYAGFEIAYHLYLYDGTEYKAEFKDNTPLDFEFILYANERSDVDVLFAILPPAYLGKLKIIEENLYVGLILNVQFTQISPQEFLDFGVIYGKLMAEKYAYFIDKKLMTNYYESLIKN